jgi:hypothetical protein
VKKKPTTPLSREAEAFIEMLSAERGASKNTEAAYSADLKNLEAFLARRKQKPRSADAEALRAYLKSLDYVGMTPRTVARRLSVIRQFFRFLLAERLREDDPANKDWRAAAWSDDSVRQGREPDRHETDSSGCARVAKSELVLCQNRVRCRDGTCRTARRARQRGPCGTGQAAQ